MRKSSQFVLAAGLAGLLLTTSSFAQEKQKVEAPAEPNGQELAFNNRKGNCLACHLMPGVQGAVSSATIGPPLIAMKARFPDKAKLREQVWDASKFVPASAMPPFGKHLILTDKEIDKIVDFIYGI